MRIDGRDPDPMRADKTDQSFVAVIHLAAAIINSR
jgi:hypothetical protein